MALQQTTRELWASQGPFEPYTIHGIAQQNIPDIYIKGAVWNAQSTPARYHAWSSAPEESASRTWFPIEFNEEHMCWVEVRWIEPPGSEGYWQVFRIAGEDLGVDITQGDVEFHLQSTPLTNYQESVASSHSVTCRWHVRLDVSWVGSVANSAEVTVLRSDPKPLLS
jgi:hypothetical protein